MLRSRMPPLNTIAEQYRALSLAARDAEPTAAAQPSGVKDKGCAILLEQQSNPAGMVELADAADSKSAALRGMGVRPPLPAPNIVDISH